MDVQPLVAVAAASIAAGAFAQTVTGLGFALVAVPALLALMGPREGVAVVILLSVGASAIPLSRQWRHARHRDLLPMLTATLLATPLIVVALSGVDTRVVAVAAGAAVLVGVALMAASRGPWAWFRGLPGAVMAGLASAVMTVVGGVGGPPVGLYAANQGWEPVRSRATLQAFFLIQSLVTLVFVGVVIPEWWMLAALVGGTVAGTALAHRIPDRAARWAVLAVAALGGAALVAANV